MDRDSRRAPSTYPLIHEIGLRYGDADRRGHLNNVTIAGLYQEARLHLLQRALGPTIVDSRIMVVEQTLKFLGEGFPVATTFGSGVSLIGRSSYDLAHAMFQDGRCIGLCDTVLVNVGDDGKSVPIPDPMRAALEALLLKA